MPNDVQATEHLTLQAYNTNLFANIRHNNVTSLNSNQRKQK
jgi:hypothetical protein